MTQQTAPATVEANGTQDGAEAIPLPPVPPDLCLAERLAGVAAEVKAVAKSGRNAHFGYSYQRAEDVAASVAPVLARYGVAITPRIDHTAVSSEVTGQTKGGSDIRLYTVPVVLRVACRGEADDVPWLAQATDDGDKGINKAITAALKSFLRAQFLIPTGEDDTDSGSGSGDGGAQSTGEWTGELPDVAPGSGVTGYLAVAPDGRIGVSFKAEDRGAFDSIKDSVKAIPGRKWDPDASIWTVPAAQASTAVVLARHLGLAIPDALSARFPANQPGAAADPPPPDGSLPPADGPGPTGATGRVGPGSPNPDDAAWDNFDAGARAQAAAARGGSDDRRPDSDDDIPF